MTAAIAFQGVPGAYSDLACRAMAPSYTPLPCPTFEDAFAAVQEGLAERALLPVENSTAGRVAAVHCVLPEAGLSIVGEHYQPVVHHLLAVPGAQLGTITQALSLDQGLAQCRLWLREHHIHPVAYSDTAAAAAEVAQRGDPTVAAIASQRAGELYGLISLASDIADVRPNTTRFLLLARESVWPPVGSVPCITSLVFRVRSVPAALYKALGGFATNGVNITKIESYLVDERFTAAQFHLDLEGHVDEEPVNRALEELRFFAHEVTVLGVYPAHPFRRNTGATS